MTGKRFEGVKMAIDAKVLAVENFAEKHPWVVRIAWTFFVFCIGAAIGSRG